METQYYIAIDGQQKGPFAVDQLLDAGLQRNSLVWHEGCSSWRRACEIDELKALLAATPSAKSQQSSRPQGIEPPLNDPPRYPEEYLRYPYAVGMRTGAWMLRVLLLALAIRMIGWLPIDTRGEIIPRILGGLFIVCSIAGQILLLVTVVSFMIFLYRSWALIQDGRAPTTPGRAVGFLFLPLFQLYWVFVATFGLARAMNRFADRHRLMAPRVSILLGLAVPIYVVLASIPILGLPIALYCLLIVPLFFRSIYRAARGFCDGNRVTSEDNAPVARPMFALPALVMGIAAIALSILAPLLITGGVLGIQFARAEQERAIESHAENMRRLADMHKGAWQRDRLPPEAAVLEERIAREGQEIHQRARHLLLGSYGAIACGIVMYLATIVLALRARARNALLEQELELLSEDS